MNKNNILTEKDTSHPSMSRLHLLCRKTLNPPNAILRLKHVGVVTVVIEKNVEEE
jgi:hypothetical protein